MNISTPCFQVLFSIATLSFVGVISVIQISSYVAILILIHSDSQFTGSGWANTVASNQAANGTKLRNGFARLIKLEMTYEFKFLFNLAWKLEKILYSAYILKPIHSYFMCLVFNIYPPHPFQVCRIQL